MTISCTMEADARNQGSKSSSLPIYGQIKHQISKLWFLYDVLSTFIWEMYPCPFPEGEDVTTTSKQKRAASGGHSSGNKLNSSESTRESPHSDAFTTTIWNILDFVCFYQLENIISWFRSAAIVMPRTSIENVKNVYNNDSANALTAALICLSSTPELSRRIEAFLSSKQALSADANVLRFLRSLQRVFKCIADKESFREDVVSVVNAAADVSLKSLAVDVRGGNKAVAFLKQFTDRVNRYFHASRESFSTKWNEEQWKLLCKNDAPITDISVEEVISQINQDGDPSGCILTNLITSAAAAWNNSTQASTLSGIFSGQLTRIRQCLSCMHVYAKNSMFSILELSNINEEASRMQSLNKLLVTSNVNTDDDVNTCVCTKCSSSNSSPRWQEAVILSYPPPFLIMTIGKPEPKQPQIPPRKLTCPNLADVSKVAESFSVIPNAIVYELCAVITETANSSNPYSVLFSTGDCWWETDGKVRKQVENLDLYLRSHSLKGHPSVVCYKNAKLN